MAKGNEKAMTRRYQTAVNDIAADIVLRATKEYGKRFQKFIVAKAKSVIANYYKYEPILYNRTYQFRDKSMYTIMEEHGRNTKGPCGKNKNNKFIVGCTAGIGFKVMHYENAGISDENIQQRTFYEGLHGPYTDKNGAPRILLLEEAGKWSSRMTTKGFIGAIERYINRTSLKRLKQYR